MQAVVIHKFKTGRELIKHLADHVVEISKDSISSNGEFNVALSGGNSPKGLYEWLASPGMNRQVNWEKVNFFFGDERYVPAGDPESNAGMVKRTLFDPLHISPARIFTVDTSLTPEEAAGKYAATIADHFKGREARFDLILLGLGENAHTASLFPYTPVLSERTASVKAVFLEKQKVYRITMTAPLINQARHIAFLVYGNAKAEAVQHVLEGVSDAEKYPAQLIRPGNGDLRWYLDEAAASLLRKES